MNATTVEIARREARRAASRRKLALLLDATGGRPAPAPARSYGHAWSMDRTGRPMPVAPASFHVVKIAY